MEYAAEYDDPTPTTRRDTYTTGIAPYKTDDGNPDDGIGAGRGACPTKNHTSAAREVMKLC